jgi:hypothetical protein
MNPPSERRFPRLPLAKAETEAAAGPYCSSKLMFTV